LLRVLSRLRGSLPQRTLPALRLAALAAGGSLGHPRFARDPLRRATRSPRAVPGVASSPGTRELADCCRSDSLSYLLFTPACRMRS